MTFQQIPSEQNKQSDWATAISDHIAEAIERKGMNQRAFAKQMGCSEAEVSRWVGGMHNFTLSTLAKISATLGEDLINV